MARSHRHKNRSRAVGKSTTVCEAMGSISSGPDGPKGLDQATAAAVWAPLRPANTRLRAPWRRPAVCHLFFTASLARRLPDTGSDRCSLHAWPHRARFGRIVRIEDVAAGIRRTNFDDSLREADHSFRRDRRPRDHGTEPRSAGPSGRASQHPTGPFSKSEMKFVASVSVADLERQADQLSKTFRELGTRIQELNLEDGCDLRVVGSQAGQGGREPSQG